MEVLLETEVDLSDQETRMAQTRLNLLHWRPSVVGQVGMGGA